MSNDSKRYEGVVTFLDVDDGTGYIKLLDVEDGKWEIELPYDETLEFDRQSLLNVKPRDLCEGMPVHFKIQGEGDEALAIAIQATQKALAMAKQEIPTVVQSLLNKSDTTLYSCDFTADGSKAILLVSFAWETFDLFIYEVADKSMRNLHNEKCSLTDIPATKAFWSEDEKSILIVNDDNPERLYFPFEFVDGQVKQGETLIDTPELRDRSKYIRALVT